MKKENVASENSCTEGKLLNQNLTEENLTAAALRDTEFDNQDESDQYSIFS